MMPLTLNPKFWAVRQSTGDSKSIEEGPAAHCRSVQRPYLYTWSGGGFRLMACVSLFCPSGLFSHTSSPAALHVSLLYLLSTTHSSSLRPQQHGTQGETKLSGFLLHAVPTSWGRVKYVGSPLTPQVASGIQGSTSLGSVKPQDQSWRSRPNVIKFSHSLNP